MIPAPQLLEWDTQQGGSVRGFSLVPMLLGESISPETRQASREHRLKDAGELLIQEYGLTCGEVSDLLDVSMC
jgi:hypothetical protein